jgi:vancomycin resistance protein VanW
MRTGEDHESTKGRKHERAASDGEGTPSPKGESQKIRKSERVVPFSISSFLRSAIGPFRFVFSRFRAFVIAFAGVGLGLALIVGLGVWAALSPGGEYQIGCYSTGLRGRTPSQVHNLILATKRISGTVLLPGQTFSFVKTVGPWTADMGYEKAPVSYDGELIRSWGGGVCQTSTTLYNAALIAGLQIIERHKHHWPARYAPLGRDAAVAYSDIDLKFRNNLPAPVRIVGDVKGDRVSFRLLSTCRPAYRVEIESQTRSVTRPGQIVLGSAGGHGRVRLVNRGHPGFHVVTYRHFVSSGKDRREMLSEDDYPVMDRVVRIAER